MGSRLAVSCWWSSATLAASLKTGMTIERYGRAAIRRRIGGGSGGRVASRRPHGRLARVGILAAVRAPTAVFVIAMAAKPAPLSDEEQAIRILRLSHLTYT